MLSLTKNDTTTTEIEFTEIVRIMPCSSFQSGYLQKLAVFAGSQTVYASAEEYLSKFLRINLSDSTIFRESNQAGQNCESEL